MKNELEEILNRTSGLSYVDKIECLQNQLIAMESGGIETPDFLGAVECNDGGNEVLYPSWSKYNHHFSDGLYVREAFFPKDALIFSVIHKQANPLFLLSGSIVVATPDGVKELVGPTYILTEPGIKRVVLHLEDSIIITVHPNPDGLTDLKEMEKRIFACKWEQYDYNLSKNGWETIKHDEYYRDDKKNKL